MKKTKFMCVLSIAAVASLTGCFGKKSSEEEQRDETKAQLEIVTFDGGVGDAWLKNAAEEFMQQNKERTDFEDGKVGVQISVSKDRNGGDYYRDTDLKKDMYFTENVDYYYLTNQNKFLDITDILTEANPNDGNKTILSKINPNLKEYMNRGGKYYAIPFYDCIYGLVYDKDLFAEEGFYLKDDGTFTSNQAEFGVGPNGLAGDWDDGLPKTYAQFKSMMQEMRDNGVTPFNYVKTGGAGDGYTTKALASFWSDDEGYADAQLNYTFSGQAKHIVTGFSGDVANTTEVTISKNNGYELKKQAGVYNALNFTKSVLCETSENYKPENDNSSAQYDFVNVKEIGGSTKPIAMMFEGTWWENEAVESFNAAKRKNPNRSFNYGLMPIPKSSDDKVGEDATFLNLNNSYGFISATSSHQKLAKEFFKFLHTDAQLRQFTVTTSMTRGLDYTLTSADIAKVSSFAKDLISIKQSEHAKLVYPVSGETFFINHPETFKAETWIWDAGTKGSNPLLDFVSKPSLTAKEYFEAHEMSATDWNKLFN